MVGRVEFKPNPNDPQWEVKYWSGAIDSYHGSTYISATVTHLDYSSYRKRPGLPHFELKVLLPPVNGLNYPALLSHQFGSSAYLLDGRWQVSARRALSFLQMIEPFLIIKRLQAQHGIEFQQDTAYTNKLPSSERTEYRLTIGETYYPEMTALNNKDIYDQSRFNVPDQLDPAYVIGMMEFGLIPIKDERKAGRMIAGLNLGWRSRKTAVKVQDYFGGGIVDTTREGFRNVWGIENGRVLLAQVQPYFKLRYIVDLKEPFMSNPALRELFTDYHRGMVNLAIALRYPYASPKHLDKGLDPVDQIDRVGFTYGYVAGLKQRLDGLGLSEYTEKSQQQADRLLSLK